MASLQDFSPTLQGWLRTVWYDRGTIMQEARQHGAVEGGWQVYDRYNAPGAQVAPLDRFVQFLVAAKGIVRQANQRGQGLRLASQTGREIPDDFYHFLPVPRVGGAAYRIYLHTTQPVTLRALPIVSMVVDRMQARPGIDEVKVAGPGMPAARRDTIVIYLRDEMLVPWMIRELRTSESAGFTQDPVPSGTKRVHPGISWAEQPPDTTVGDGTYLTEIWGRGRHSFGSYLAGCIFRALWSNPGSGAEFLDFVIAAFREAGIDPRKPHLFDRPAPAPLIPNAQWLAMKGIPSAQ
ncbi:MAG: T3SS effector HopA1 family protein [Gemmatimonadota bacterium]